MNRVLITGGGGIVGSYAKQVFDVDNVDLLVTNKKDTKSKNYLDCTDYFQILRCVNEFMPKVIIHLVAQTNVDKAETNKEQTYRTNTLSTIYVAHIAKQFDIKLVYVSTGGIFQSNDSTRLFNEYDQPCPPTYYGKTKWYGEQEVKNIMGSNFVIARAGWMMGGGLEIDHKFVGFMSKILLKSKQKDVHCVNDVFGSPTYALDLLVGIRNILNLRKNVTGVYHLNNGLDAPVSRCDILKIMNDVLGTNKNIIPVPSTHFHLDATRPPSESIISVKTKPEGIEQRFWETSLIQYLENEIKKEK